jgi:membrane-bound lytic murein transglycosylase D
LFKSQYFDYDWICGAPTLAVDRVVVPVFLLGLMLVIFGGLNLYKDLQWVTRVKRNSFLLKRVGRVHLFLNEQISVPFSCWWPGHIGIVIPTTFVLKPDDFRIAVKHELQHHRHGDTYWVYVMWGLKLFYLLNPEIYFRTKWISELQEFACDEALVDQNKVESQAYAHCLVAVAIWLDLGFSATDCSVSDSAKEVS